MEKLKVALFFGGKSAEHEVSLQSARNVYQALDKEKYDIILIGITKEGRWILSSEKRLQEAQVQKIDESSVNSEDNIALVPQSKKLSITENQAIYQESFDVIFPVLHGPFGEDGSLQGLCKILDLPYVGPGVLGSAVGMDKDVMKRLLREAGLPVAKALTLMKHESVPLFSELQTMFGENFFVKPANLGSSVGVSRVKNEKEYTDALAHAFLYDAKILIEEAIEGREIECSVLGNEHPKASLVGEVIINQNAHTFYSYDAKYLDEKGATIIIPADISAEKMQEVQELAIKVFRTLCCEGMGRVDFFLKKDGSLVVNEINTIPGFTEISMYPKLWEASGLSYSQLLDELIQLSLQRFEREKSLKTVF